MTGHDATPEHHLGTLSADDLRGRIDGFLIARMQPGGRFGARLIQPRLSWNRLDVAIKLNYLERSAAGNAAFARELYDAHIHAFSLGDFRETGNDEKTDATSFRAAFERIIDSLRINGFDSARSLVPVATDGSPINGGHRVAAALFLGLPLPVVETGLPPVRYDADYFLRRGMDRDLVGAAVLAYLDRNSSTSLVLGGGTRPETVCRRVVPLRPRGLANLRTALQHVADEAGVGLADRLPTVGPLDLILTDRPPPGSGPGIVVPGPLDEAARSLVATLLFEGNACLLDEADPAALVSLISAGTQPGVVLGPDALLALHGGPSASVGASPTLKAPTETPDQASASATILDDPRRHRRLGAIVVVSPAEALRWSGPGGSHNGRLRTLARRDRRRSWRRDGGRTARLMVSRLRRAAILTARRLGLQPQLRRAYSALRRPRG